MSDLDRVGALGRAILEARELGRKMGFSVTDDLAIAQLLVLIEIRGDLAKIANPMMIADGHTQNPPPIDPECFKGKTYSVR